MCAKAIDIGTCFIVGGELREGKEVFTTERDAFFSMPNEDFAEEMLTKAGAFFLTKGDLLYVVGEDALKFSMVTGNQKDYRRPMARGVLNPGEEEAVGMMEVIMEAVLGRPNYPNEVVAATIPANPVDSDFNITYHQMIIERFLKKLGYDPRIINEGLAVIYAENPAVESQGVTIPFTGVGISFGAGMANLCVAWRGKRLLEFSATRGGDWVDEQVAKVRNLPMSKVTAFKEKHLNFNNIDPSDQILVALEIYYEDLISYVLEHFKEQFKKSKATIDEPVEIILAGGTVCPPGFPKKFEQTLNRVKLPFPVKGVRLAKNPLKAIASGALVAAITQEKKRDRDKKDEKAAPTLHKRTATAAPERTGEPKPAPPPSTTIGDFDVDADVSLGPSAPASPGGAKSGPPPLISR